ncbi:MAG: hypothetical protein MUF25_18685 [Pirellulaceae bacterium]|nr:hypothetical protein [Pirellulaceae bacterium]
MLNSEAAQALISEGRRLQRGPRQFVPFTGVDAVDRQCNNLERHPHLFVLGCVCDLQVKTETAWQIPVRLADLAGSARFSALEALPDRRIRHLLKGPPALHRFPEQVARRIRGALTNLRASYRGNAALIWTGTLPSAEVVYRFLQFDAGDYSSIDISVDRHVRRVFERLNLVAPGAPNEHLIFRARAIYPRFPGLLDRPAFELGRTWCKERAPLCSTCPLSAVCPTA